MKTKAIIGVTEEVYHIDREVLKFLNYTYLNEADEELIAVGMRYAGKNAFDMIIIDGVEYNWEIGGVIPTTYNIKPRDIKHIDSIDYLNKYQKMVLYQLIDGSCICSVSHYKVDQESLQKRIREKKFERIVKNDK